MKRIYKTVLFLLFTSSCALEKEPLIPTGVSNEQLPIFTSTKINFDDNKVLVAEAELSTLGNIQIKTFGWVWDSLPVPSVKNDAKLEFGNLSRKTFSSKIENLTDGPIFIRPFAVTYSDTVYGLEQNYMVGGINIEFIEPEIFENASIVFKNTTKSMNQYQWTWNFGDGFVSNSPSPTPGT